MSSGTKLSLLLVLTGFSLTGLFFFGVFLSGEELATVDIWKQDESMPAKEVLAGRKSPEAYEAHSVEIAPEMNPISISIAHWSREVGFPRSSEFTLDVENAAGRSIFKKEIKLSQKKSEGGSGTVIFQWTAETPVINLMNDYLEVPETGIYTFRLRPGARQEAKHTRLQLRLRQQAIRPQWWMIIAGLPMVFLGVASFMISGLMRMRGVLKDRPTSEKNE